MKARKWSAEDKQAIVLSGLRGQRSVDDLCRDHQIAQSQYYKWRDQFLAGGLRALSGHGPNGSGQQQRQVEQLEQIIGKQAVAIELLKKLQ